MLPKVSMLAAVACNGVIGSNREIPWRLPSDMARFRTITMGKVLIVGRKTADTIELPLLGRHTIVVSRTEPFHKNGAVSLASSIEQAIGQAIMAALRRRVNEIVVIGGQSLYETFMPLADTLYITEVDLEPEGDTYFPQFDKSCWRMLREEGLRTSRDSANFAFTVYDRIQTA